MRIAHGCVRQGGLRGGGGGLGGGLGRLVNKGWGGGVPPSLAGLTNTPQLNGMHCKCYENKMNQMGMGIGCK